MRLPRAHSVRGLALAPHCPSQRAAYVSAYREAARRDPFAAVRMAALSGLSQTNPLAARDELRYAEMNESEPEVVALARKLREHP
jgi:hypothetical protein